MIFIKDNILISQDGTPRLADFGLSRELMQTLSQNPSKIAGAARWMAREYMGELNTPTKAGDVWAFGMTVLVCYTRPLCYDGRSIIDLPIGACNP